MTLNNYQHETHHFRNLLSVTKIYKVSILSSAVKSSIELGLLVGKNWNPAGEW